jgi:hypothetical protein
MVNRHIGAKRTITSETDNCGFRRKNALFSERMRVEPIFVAVESLYFDLSERRRHVAQFGLRWMVTGFGPDDRFVGMSVTAEPTGVHY